MKIYSRFLLSLLLLLILIPGLLFCQSYLHTSGNIIVNSSGQEVKLKGIGLGGWLLMEGYMLHTSGFANAQWEIKEKILNLVGEQNAESFYQAYHENYVNKPDVNKIKEWGFNSIRLPFHYNILTPPDSPGVYLEHGFAIIDSVLSWCESNQLYLILDMHAAPGGQSDEPISDYNPAFPSLWESSANKDRAVDIWRKIAERYKDEQWLGGYDLLNEPKWYLPPGNQPLRDLYIRITDTIRTVDTNHIIYIEGNWFATDFTGLTPPWDNNMVYSFHKYGNENNQGSIQYFINLRNNFNVPLWLGEAGENSNCWFVDCVELMNANNIGWCWWPHKKIDATACPLSIKLLQNYQTLLDYWNGIGPAPSVQFATNALLQQAEALSIEHCDFHPDVIDALIRQPNNNLTIPFKQNLIPGIINGIDYDLGKRGYAYQDTDYQNIGNGSWNNGWSFRNDGVDIEPCADPFSSGYNIGWIENGEWINYTVNVQQSGMYDVYFRVASENSNGKLLVKLDGQFFINYLNIPNTGGWQNWETISANNLSLNSGTHLFQIQAITGGFNYNYAEFVLTSSSVDDEEQSIKEFKLLQNYPNPFNPDTNIKFFVPYRSNVEIKLFDLTGRIISTLENREFEAGNYNLKLNAESLNLSSGIYFYQAQFDFNKILTRKAILIK